MCLKLKWLHTGLGLHLCLRWDGGIYATAWFGWYMGDSNPEPARHAGDNQVDHGDQVPIPCVGDVLNAEPAGDRVVV
jgi:hypothetical protein